ncbi:MAG: hypothetical protein IKP06_05720 [Elusimicrobiaceae bacterium]|nr:hypothetical protein [Elusimicrobiaceae bacterium]
MNKRLHLLFIFTFVTVFPLWAQNGSGIIPATTLLAGFDYQIKVPALR